MSKDYVIVLCQINGYIVGGGDCCDVLLIEKDRPEWQKGKLNLPGGKVEDYEPTDEAARRELLEETGIVAYSVHRMGLMKDREFRIHCYEAIVPTSRELKPREGETEVPCWMSLEKAFADKRLMPNLRVIIPLIRSGMKDWVIEDDARSVTGSQHTIKVTVPTHS